MFTGSPCFGRVAVALCLSLSLLSAAWAQSDAVVITGSREPLAPDRLVADVVVVDAATIATTTADSLAELLRREAGVEVSRTGGPGQSTGIFIRGATSQQTVVLIDGVRVGSATLGSTALESVGLGDIDHIEILRGPGSSIYGADAVGGVVQIFTRRGAPGLRVDGHVGVGGYGSSDDALGVSGGHGLFDFGASLAHESSRSVSALRPGDPYGNYNPDGDGYALDTSQAHLGLTPVPGQHLGLSLIGTRLDAQYDSSEYLPPNYVQDASPDFRNLERTSLVALDWRGALGQGLTGSVRASSYVDDARDGADVVERVTTTRRQFAAQLAWQTGVVGQLVAALEHEDDEADSTDYAFMPQRHTDAVAFELTGAAARWSWQADLRHDRNSDVGGVTTGSLGGGVLLLPGLRLRALAGTTFRAPSFNDLYYPDYGVPTLHPERGRSVEAGLVWKGERTDATLTVYRNEVRDLISYESDPNLCPIGPAYAYGCAANTDHALLQGGTLSASQRLGAWALRAQLDLLAAHDLETGARLPRRAAHQVSLGADWTHGDWTWGANLQNLGARPDSGAELPAETTLDLSAIWRLTPAWQLQAKLLDATNVDTQPALGYQAPRRQTWLVLRYAAAQ